MMTKKIKSYDKIETVLANIFITTIYLLLIRILSRTGLAIHTILVCFVFVLYLCALYFVMCKVHRQKIKVMGFIISMLCGGIKYVGDIVVESFWLAVEYSSDKMMNALIAYNHIFEVILWESFFKELIQLFALVIFMVSCCLIWKTNMRSLNRKYTGCFLVLLVLYILVVLGASLISKNMIGTIFAEIKNPIRGINVIFYYMESVILWLIIDGLDFEQQEYISQ